MKMKSIGSGELKLLATEIEEAVQSVAKKHGIQIKRGRGVYGGSNASLKLELAVVGKGGQAQTREAEDFKRYASVYGLKAENLGAEFTDFDGEVYTITGLKPRSRKYPILVERVDGMGFKMPAERVKVGLAR
jgi:hypothetical protein